MNLLEKLEVLKRSFNKEPIIKKVILALKRQVNLNRENKILVGLSGGKDSTFLLISLYLLKERFHLKLFAFHLNHLIRGEEAKRDEEFCREFCRQLRIPILVKRSEVKGYAQRRKLSLEEAGRLIRYRLLEAERRKKGLDYIALAHTATDNAETMLFSLIQGKGLSGIAGIPERRERIIRPLIDLKREEIEEFLNRYNLAYVLDTTNLSLSQPRNYIRHIVFPFLKGLNPNLEETMRQTAKILQAEDAFLRELVESELNRVQVRRIKGGRIFDRNGILSYNLCIRRRILREFFKDMPFADLERLIELVEKPVGKEAVLKGGLWAVRERHGIFIGERDFGKGFSRQLAVGRVNEIPEIGLNLRLEMKGLKELKMGRKDREYFDWEEISPPLYLRSWRAGDFLDYEEGRKKLKDLFVDFKVPKRLKGNFPILVDQKGLLWVLGLRRANRAKVSDKTEKVLEVRIERWRDQIIKV